MYNFTKVLLALSLSGTLLTLILFICKPLYKNRLSQKWQYYIWLIVIARLLLPFTTGLHMTDNFCKQIRNSIDTNYLYSEDNIQTKTTGNKAISTPTTDKENIIDNKKPIFLSKYKKIMPYMKKYSFSLWLIIAISLFIRKVTQYQSFIKYIKAGKTEITSLGFWELLGNQIEKLNIKTPVNLYENNLISSPLLIGFFHPCIMLPSADFSNTDFQNIILHELIHFKRKDMFYKWLLQFTICLYWFNPFVYLMGFEINRLCELSCDETVIKRLNEKGKREYGETLLNTIKKENSLKSSIASVTLNEGKNLLKERMGFIMKFKEKTKIHSIISLMLGIILCITATSLGDAFIKNTKVTAETSETAKKNSTKKKETAFTFHDSDLSLIDEYIKNNKVILNNNIYYILCNGATKKDMPNGGGDGINITIVTKPGYASMGCSDLDTVVEDIKETCKKWLSSKTITKKQAKLAIGLAIRLEENNGKLENIKNLADSTIKEYKKWNITKDDDGNFYYKKKRISVLLELNADNSFQRLYCDKKGTVTIKITRNKKGQIKSLSGLTKKEAKKYSINKQRVNQYHSVN